MTIATTLGDNGVTGDKQYAFGTSVLSGGSSSGDVVTGLVSVDMFLSINIGATAKTVSINESLPLAGGTVTAYTESANATFSWLAIGK